MKKSERVYRTLCRHAAILSLVQMSCTGMSAHALPQADDLISDQLSVRELMRLDTEHALKRALARVSDSGQRVSDSPPRISRNMMGEPRLAAIYGVGRQLMAEVVLDHVIYLYRRGLALPVGVAPGDDVYVLRSISTSCIELEKPGSSHHLCLRPNQWVGK